MNKTHGRRKGSQLIEFTLILFPFLGMLGVVLDESWAIFTQGTLQWAVRTAVHTGVQLTASQMATGACLTDTVKTMVQKNSLGLLSGTSGLAKIKIHYLQPPDASSGGAATDVSAQSTGDSPGNIMQVSVQSYSLIPMMAHFWDGTGSPNYAPMSITVYSAGMIESSGTGGNIPCIGTAP